MAVPTGSYTQTGYVGPYGAKMRWNEAAMMNTAIIASLNTPSRDGVNTFNFQQPPSPILDRNMLLNLPPDSNDFSPAGRLAQYNYKRAQQGGSNAKSNIVFRTNLSLGIR